MSGDEANVREKESAFDRASVERLLALKDDRIWDLDVRLRKLEFALAEIEKTAVWRFGTRWYAVREWLRRLFGRHVGKGGEIARAVEMHRSPRPLYEGAAVDPGAARPRAGRRKVLFISHNAHVMGAPMVLLHLLRWLKEHTDIPFEILLKDPGDLQPEFEELAPVILWNEAPPPGAPPPSPEEEKAHADRMRRRYARAGIGLIYSNTISNGVIQAELSSLRCPIICHAHELDHCMQHITGSPNNDAVRETTAHYIAASRAVKLSLMRNLKVPEGMIDVVHEFLPLRSWSPPSEEGARKVRDSLRIPGGAPIVGAAGTVDWRKGSDLFVHLARLVRGRSPDRPVFFLWVGGDEDGPVIGTFRHDVRRLGLEGSVCFTGLRRNPLDYFSLFDVFALVSREDPFPLVMLEAASLGKPIVCFDGGGGAPEFVEDDCGFVVPYLDCEAMAGRVLELLDSPPLRRAMGERGARKVRERHDVGVVGPRIAAVIRRFLPPA
ncbi:MAG: glycosyltransferase family 4 protein [bacterium]|nr:glycosyltransferase family 4 protein [bacterium]